MYFLIVWQSVDKVKMVEVFTTEEDRNRYVEDALFNQYGGTAADLDEYEARDFTVFVELNKKASIQFH